VGGSGSAGSLWILRAGLHAVHVKVNILY
jgi:hypothetical protein